MSDEYVSRLCLWGEMDKALEVLNACVDTLPPDDAFYLSAVFRALAASDALREFYGPRCVSHIYYDLREHVYVHRFHLLGGVAVGY